MLRGANVRGTLRGNEAPSGLRGSLVAMIAVRNKKIIKYVKTTISINTCLFTACKLIKLQIVKTKRDV